ncbi:MAG: (Fe-S)-binding protein [Candidatus Latescibacterota bacterium]
MSDYLDAVKKTRAWACYDCGKCTATCPISRVGGDYSPRKHVLATNLADKDVIENGSLNSCLTCGLCDQRCPAEVAYTDLVLKLRELSHKEGVTPECPHGGAMQSMMRMMADGGTQQKRLEWLGDDLKTDPKQGEIFYWTGCTMYYDAFFTDLKLSTLDGTKAAVQLMNYLDVTPVVSPDERCCGHDLLWNGDRKNFEKLAMHNVKLVADSGAKVLVTSCAECLRTWKVDYAPFFKGAPPKIVHISQYLEDHKKYLRYPAAEKRRVTFQDPCRLGRHLGIYDPPRDLLSSLPTVELAEMQRHGPSAICCAGGTWSNCDKFAKKIQVNRLRDARSTGAEVLATACPKCQVHFRCTMQDPNLKGEIEMEMVDIAKLVVDSLAPQAASKGKESKE